MNRIILLVFLVFSYCMGNSQAISNRGSSAVTVQDARLFAQYNFRPPAFRDTTEANTNLGLDSCGALIFTRTTNTYWLRSCTPKKWVLVGSGSNAASYITTTQINDTSYYITRSDGTKDTFLFTGGGTASGQYIDSLKRSSDSVYGRINNVFKFQYKDSVGTNGVTSIGSGYGIANSPTTITSTGSVIVDTSTSGLSGKYLRIVDTTTMLSKYLRKTDTASLSNRINLKLSISDTSTMLSPYLRAVDTSNRWINNITRTPGKDSIIFFKDGNRFAIKDSVGTNPAPVGYYGAFSDTLSQSIPNTTTASPMYFRLTDLSNGISSPDGKRIIFANSGVYNIQFSAQFTNGNLSSEKSATIWLRKNGVDIPGSSGVIQIAKKGSGLNGEILPAWNFVLSLAAGDSLVWYWSANSTDVSITSFAAATSPTRPSTASTVLTVTQQSGIMAGTGITAINGLTDAGQTMVVDSSNTTFKITSTGTSHTFTIPNASTSGVTRGLISNTQYNTFNNKIGAGDTSAMLTPYLRKVDTTAMLSPYLRKVDTASLSSRINLKLSISDTSAMLSPYLRKVDTTAMLSPYLRKVDTASLSSRINLKLSISDTSAMLSKYLRKFDTTAMLTPYLRKVDTTAMLTPYLRKIDTASLSSRIDTKLAITDTSVFQRKSLASYTFMANKTNVTANATANTFKDTTGTYTGTPTWTGGTAPTGITNAVFYYTQVGKQVTLRITMIYTTAGNASNTRVQIPLTSDMPVPAVPSGYSSTADIINFGNGYFGNQSSNYTTSATGSALTFLRGTATGSEIVVDRGTAGSGKYIWASVTYYTN